MNHVLSIGWLLLGVVACQPGPSVAQELPVIPRSAWGALETTGPCRSHRIEAISIHHTATIAKDNSKSPQRLRNYQRYHQSNKGWADLAYHLFIDLDGNIYEGRDRTCVGDTATNYDPTGHLLLVLEGNFEEQDVSPAAFDRLVEVVSWAAATHDVPFERIRRHRELAATACPGEALDALIRAPSFRLRVEKLRTASSLRLRLLPAEAGQSQVASIEGAKAP